MRLYDFDRAPNARRVRMFLAEKGIELEIITIDLNTREQMGKEFEAINSRLQVPALLLDDGTLLTESVAICRYLDELYSDPPLFGIGALGKAQVEMWHRRMELEGLQPTADAVRNSVGFFKDRAISGAVNFDQIPALAERGMKRIDLFHRILEDRISESPFLAGDLFSIADIAAIVALDFGKIVQKRVDDATPNLKRWYDKVSSRPSASA